MSVRLNVRVTPGAREDAIVGWRGDVLALRVRAVPEKGRANQAVALLLSARLRLPKTAVTVVRGHASRKKVVAVEGLDEAEVRRRLA